MLKTVPQFSITTFNDGDNAEILMNGEPIGGVIGYSVSQDVNCLPELTLKFVCHHVEIDGKVQGLVNGEIVNG